MWKILCVSVRSCQYVISNIYAIFETQFIKKLSKIYPELKKCVVYAKNRVTEQSIIVTCKVIS